MSIRLRGRWWLLPWVALAATVTIFGLTAAGPAAGQQGSGHRQVTAGTLAHALRADGSLLRRSGSFDARGYRMLLTASGAPRFVKTAAPDTAPAIAPVATADDSSWSENFGESGAGA